MNKNIEKARSTNEKVNRCTWPVPCSRPAAARKSQRGPAPAYCEEADAPGQPIHNALNAYRMKIKPDLSDSDNGGEDRTPVATAARTAAMALDRAEQLVAALRETAEHVAESIHTAGDPDAAATQIAAAIADAEEERNQARTQAARDKAARLNAEARAEAAHKAAWAQTVIATGLYRSRF
jgi:hypothetical protein